ncbi:MAG: hypothetical protein AMXMBFR47_20240 [Planctomycetota bacterium]
MGWLSKRKQGDPDDGPLDIPPGTAVDPALFPEDEFPVECLGCGYALRGLPDGRCPECGNGFVRGELLVDTYYHCRTPLSKRAARRHVFFTRAALGFRLLFIASILGALFASARSPGLANVRPNGAAHAVWIQLVFGLLLVSILGQAIMTRRINAGLPPKAKRDAVRAALISGIQTQIRP